MSKKFYFKISAIIFSLVFLLHGARAIYGWVLIIGGVDVAMWVSYVAVLIAGIMAYYGWRFGK